MANEILQVNGLKTHFFTRAGVVKAVDDVTFSLCSGETLGLVGESGSGKTITSLSILQLVPKPAGRIVGGEIIFQGEDLLKKTEDQMRRVRGKHISMILQDPMMALNPAFSIGEQLMEAIHIHQKQKGKGLREKAKEMLTLVRVPSPEIRLGQYPHQMSGGMRQRVVGGIALSCQPEILIADEPTTSLDVTIQAQYLLLLKEIQHEMGMAILFITHDFGIVARMCDRVAVMYAGKIVEMASVEEIFDRPAHPYTSALMKSLPAVEKGMKRLPHVEGEPPPLYDLPKGCSFVPRCGKKVQRCAEEAPPACEPDEKHSVRCWLYA